MDFCRCDSTTGEAIADQIIGQLRDWNIPLHNCKSQTYDSAGNMSGSQRGVAARIKAFNNKVICTHCASHKLNVATVKALKYPNVRNMMYTADKIVRFYNNSPKRQVNLQSWIEEMKREKEDEHNIQKLQEMCKTRWI